MDPSNKIPNPENNYETNAAQNLSTVNANVAPTTVSMAEERSNSMSQYNVRNPAVKRIMREAQEMSRNTDDGIFARPLEDNIFEWHFTIRGTEGTEFELGLYHGRIILPTDYPMKPPSIIMLTPNGRFEVGVKICLSISSYHPETWRPSWSIRTALLALQSFMNTPSPGAIGSLDYSPEIRKGMARKSLLWVCPTCGPNFGHPSVQRKTTNANVSVNSNENDVIITGPSAALRVFHTPATPRSEDDPELVTADHRILPFHDNRAGDVPRFGLDDSPGNDNPLPTPIDDDERTIELLEGLRELNRHVLENPQTNPMYMLTIIGITTAILGILIRRLFNSYYG